MLKSCRNLTNCDVLGCNKNLQSDDFLNSFGDYCPQILTVNLSKCKFLFDAKISSTMANKCKFITNLNISTVCSHLFSFDDMTCFAHSFLFLRRVEFHERFTHEDVAFNLFACKFESFSRIDFSHVLIEGTPLPPVQQTAALNSYLVSEVDSDTVSPIVERCGDLKSLTLSKNRRFRDLSVFHPLFTDNLQILRLGGRDKENKLWSTKDVNNTSLLYLACACSNLIEFSLYDCVFVTDTRICAVLTSNRKLRKLTCIGCTQTTFDAIIDTLCVHNPNIQELETSVAVLSDECVESIKTSCQQLIYFRMSGAGSGADEFYQVNVLEDW
jgi:hypothetical protein